MIEDHEETEIVRKRSASQEHRRPQLQHLAVLAAHGDVLPGGVHRADRRRRAEEGDGRPVFVRLVCNPALALENAQDVTLGRDEEVANLLLTGASLRKCEHAALQNPLGLLPSFPLLSLPALHVPVAYRVSAARDKRRAVVRELHLLHGATDIQTFEIGVSACQTCQVSEVTSVQERQIFKQGGGANVLISVAA